VDDKGTINTPPAAAAVAREVVIGVDKPGPRELTVDGALRRVKVEMASIGQAPLSLQSLTSRRESKSTAAEGEALWLDAEQLPPEEGSDMWWQPSVRQITFS
jgi:hypothetical protein